MEEENRKQTARRGRGIERRKVKGCEKKRRKKKTRMTADKTSQEEGEGKNHEKNKKNPNER